MEKVSTEIIPSGIEYFLTETVLSKQCSDNVYWTQGDFYFNQQKRTATVTDVKFVSNNIIVVAHRAAAKLYLIEIKDDSFNILDSFTIETNDTSKKFFHPDLIALNANTIYMSEYTNRCCVVDIVENKLVFRRIFKLGTYSYHGVYARDHTVMLGAVKDGDIALFDTVTNNSSFLNTGINKAKRIKTLGMDGQNFVLGIDKISGTAALPGGNAESWFNLYKLNKNKFVKLDSMRFPNTQIDGHANYKNYHFITMHDGDKQCGKIVIFKVTNNKINLHKTILCGNFPHGIDVYKDKLAYTSYSNNSIILHSLSDFLDI